MADTVLALRLEAQLLSGTPATSPLAVVERLLAMQGQDFRGARLAVRARSSGLHASDVHAALADRSLLISWLNRGTLHLVRPADYWWLQRLTTPQLAAGNASRLRQEGVPPEAAERGVDTIERALAADGPLTRAQLRERVAAAGVRVEGQALVHILFLAALRGLTVRGPVVGGEQAFVLVRDWLGDPPRVDREEALGWLAQRYLAGHGPATDRDLARWAGLPLRDARSGLRAIAPHLDELPGGLLDLAGRGSPPPLPPPRLLGPFDPLLLGWTSREAVLGEHTQLVTVNGIFRPFALVKGRAAATWGMPARRVDLVPLRPLTKAETAALRADARDVERFMDLTPS